MEHLDVVEILDEIIRMSQLTTQEPRPKTPTRTNFLGQNQQTFNLKQTGSNQVADLNRGILDWMTRGIGRDNITASDVMLKHASRIMW